MAVNFQEYRVYFIVNMLPPVEDYCDMSLLKGTSNEEIINLILSEDKYEMYKDYKHCIKIIQKEPRLNVYR